MTDVAIDRCILRIRRTSGWAWGAAPSALLDAARRALPELIAARLPAIADELAAAVHVREPVRIRIATTVRELAALADSFAGDATALRVRIADQVASAVSAAVVHAPRDQVAMAEGAAGSASVSPGGGDAAVALVAEPDLDAQLRALRGWSRSGVLAEVLPAITEAAAATLHALVLGAAAAGEPPAAALLALAHEAHAALSATPAIRDAVRQRIAIAAALLDGVPAASTVQLRAAVDAVLPIATVPDLRGTAAASSTEPIAPVVGDEPGAAGVVRRATASEIEIRSVLPFLLLPALHHAGWLDTASALLAAHDLQPAGLALAAGLAAKVLDPLERGWSRSRADRLVIAAFCGTDEPIADAAIAAAAAGLRPIVPVLDAALRGVIAKARRDVPLVLWRDDRGWLLLDTDGMVALAIHTELRPLLAVAPRAPIIVPAVLADPLTLEQIELANARFVSDAARGRDETWRRFAGIDRPMITNDTATPVPRLVALTAGLDTTLALAGELAGVLAERPAIPRDPLTAFEAACTLAATAALADLGARLFPGEPTTPVLALTRFRDLDARVRFASDRIVVRVPLGRRHADLMRHGILGELARVPWLGDRTFDLGGQ